VRWFNNRYGEYFKEVKPLLTEIPKVMSLLEPIKKMSKSLGQGHVIELADEPEVIANKLKKAVTATEGGGDAPGVANLLLLLKQFGSAQVHADFVAQEKAGTIRYGDLKTAVGDAITLTFVDFRRARASLIVHPNKIAKELAVGAKRAKKTAEKTMIDVRKRVGIR
jgi:tryptophanyl-tRNA synthetase